MATIFYTDGNDTVSHNTATSDTLIFLGGNDRLNMFAGTVSAVMGEGDDFIDLRGGTSTVYGESGEDRFEILVGATLYGGGDDDLFSIKGGTGLIANGDEGNDRFNFGAAAANVLIHGGAGEEDFSGYNFASTGSIYGDSGNDLFTGFRAGMTLYGGGGNDVFRVNAGSNATFVELADDGKDTVQLMRGADFTLGDNIENLIVGTYAGADLTSATISGNAIDNAITGHNNDETINGLGGHDRLYGKGGIDTLNGGDGNDILDGGAGNDVLNGNDGNDRLNGRVGDDTMAGGTGDDIYWVDSGSDLVTEHAFQGTDTVRSTVTIVLGDNIENGVLEGSADIYLLGNALNNVLNGNGGGNIIYGYEGNDTVNGNGGNDTVAGFEGDDIVNGGSGDDAMFGMTGTDTITGGIGADTFYFNAINWSSPLEVDHVTDHEVGIDTLDLSGIDANTAVDGDQAFTYNYGAATANGIWRTIDGLTLTLYADVDGDAVADFQLLWTVSGAFTPADEIIF